MLKGMQKFLAIKLETILVIARNISRFVFRNTAGTFSGFSQHELRNVYFTCWVNVFELHGSPCTRADYS